MRYGSLTVIKKVDCGKPGLWVEAVCDCGEIELRSVKNLHSSQARGSIPQCYNCFIQKSRKQGFSNRIHGLRKHKLYDVHRQMLRRCNDFNCKDFPCYGARGISVCNEWISLHRFMDWALESGYSEGLTIERVNVNGNYCPENCTWIKNHMQATNTRKVVRITFQQMTRTLVEWEMHTGIKHNTIKNRLRCGWSVYRALTEKPVVGKNQFSL